MNKRFVIIRHAKSSWADLGQKDFDRPLNNRGIQDAPEMGKRLLELGLVPDVMYVSSAKRTQETAALIEKAINFKGEKILLEKLYHAPTEVIEEVIATADDKFDTIFIVAHNPGVTEFVVGQSKEFVTFNMPTCAIAVFDMNANSWTDFYTAKKKLKHYDFPKNR